MPDQQAWLRATEQQRDLWAAHAAEVIAENLELRRRITELERTVRLLRVQLPLIPHALPADPAGPDPRWAANIPTQRAPGDSVTSSPGPAPGQSR